MKSISLQQFGRLVAIASQERKQIDAGSLRIPPAILWVWNVFKKGLCKIDQKWRPKISKRAVCTGNLYITKCKCQKWLKHTLIWRCANTSSRAHVSKLKQQQQGMGDPLGHESGEMQVNDAMQQHKTHLKQGLPLLHRGKNFLSLLKCIKQQSCTDKPMQLKSRESAKKGGKKCCAT